MTRLGYDSFQRTDQSNWGTATDGQVWAMPVGTGTAAITNNEGTIISNSADTNMQLGTGIYTDMEILCRASISNTNDIIGFEGRFSSSGGLPTSYKFLFFSGGVHINKGISGNNFNLANATVTININTFYWYRFRIVGTGLFGKVWQDGSVEPSSWTLQATDSSIASGGIALLGNTGTGSNVVSFDSLYVVDYVLTDSVSSTEALSGVISSSIIDSLSFTDIYALQEFYGSVAIVLTTTDSLFFTTTFVASVLNFSVFNVTIRSGTVSTIVR